MTTTELFASGGIVRTSGGTYFDMRKLSTAELAEMVVAIAGEINARVMDTGSPQLQEARTEAALILADTASDLAIYEVRDARGENIH